MHTATDIREYVSSIRFRFVDPQTKPPGMGELAKLLRWLGIPLDVLNTKFADSGSEAMGKLREISKIPKMSTIAVGAIIDKVVGRMPPDEAYVNIGVWNGFTFLSGLVNNPSKTCIGVDNFRQFGGPRDQFQARFQRYKSSNHHFFDMDYVEYFAKVHRERIGVYMYDGDHSYENQLKGLELAEPFFAEDCVIFVDDTNKKTAWQATMDFVSKRVGRYQVAVDQKTARNCHPTFWDGIMIVQRIA